jgi:CRISPR-associated helicase Cas3/CRISPR-associated endonuclease Cas3-HD
VQRREWTSEVIFDLKTRALWAKKTNDGSNQWLPLITHLEDTAAVADFLWENWISGGIKETLSKHMNCSESEAKHLFVFLAAAHDVGKATPVFQSKKSFPADGTDSLADADIMERFYDMGIPIKQHKDFASPASTPHALASELIIDRYLGNKQKFRPVTVILGSHHGKTPSQGELLYGIEAYADNIHLEMRGEKIWNNLQNELASYALHLSGLSDIDEIAIPTKPDQILLTGMLIMADWIASNEQYFPYIGTQFVADGDHSEERLKKATGKLYFLRTSWLPENDWMKNSLIRERFDFSANNMQAAAERAAGEIKAPGIMVIEAQMGSGKTEAALAAAEIMAYKCHKTGLFFALPTQATTDAMFTRIENWISSMDDGLHSMELMHGKAQFNEDFGKLGHFDGSTNVFEEDGEVLPDSAVVFQWFEGRKKAMLADFVVGTVDQLLFAALKQKHFMLRHLGLANKVVVVDECHAYDAYMNVYLQRVLMWLGALNVPVILLSATLPSDKRNGLVNAYLGTAENTAGENKEVEYPRITYTDGKAIHSLHFDNEGIRKVIDIDWVDENIITMDLQQKLKEGGCAAIIMNTVKRAQQMADMLSKTFEPEEVKLFHSRFITSERLEKEKWLSDHLGHRFDRGCRPYRCIVVGTQVLEQSLDIDFDYLISDLCPVDLLLQRIGRLQRHSRIRPALLARPKCAVIKIPEEENGSMKNVSELIYGKYILMKTKAALKHSINIPADIEGLVNAVYDEDIELIPEGVAKEEYERARKEWHDGIITKEQKAKVFLINKPGSKNNIIGMLDRVLDSVNDQRAQAAVRDTDESIEVILIRRENGKYYRISDGQAIMNDVLDNEEGKRLAKETIRLPQAVCRDYCVDTIIRQIEEQDINYLPLWQRSPWIKGSLILILDENNNVKLEMNADRKQFCTIIYDKKTGLSYEVKCEEDINE